MADESLPAPPLMSPSEASSQDESQTLAKVMAVAPPAPAAPASGTPGAAIDPNFVNVRDPDTQRIGSIPRAQLNEAQAQGFQVVSQQEALTQAKKDKYDTLGQQAKTFAEGALEAGTFGLSTGVETGLGIATPEDIAGRREENPISHGAGQVAGLVGSSLLVPGGGAAGLLEEAGMGATKLAGLGAEAAVAETANAARLAGLTAKEAATVAQSVAVKNFSLGARVASAAVKSAAEGMLLQAGDEVSRAFSDPDRSVGSAMAEIGLGGLIGAGTGALGKGIGELWHARNGAGTAGALNDLLNKASNGAEFNAMLEKMGPEERKAFLSASQSEASGAGAIASDPANSEDPRKSFLDEVSRLKGNADEISEATQNLTGKKATPGMLSDSRTVQKMESDLTNRGTGSGIRKSNDLGAIYDGVNKQAESIFDDAHDVYSMEGSADAVTKRAEKEIAKKVAKKQAYFAENYEGFKEDFQNMDLAPETRRKAIADYVNDVKVRKSSAAQAEMHKIAAEMDTLETVHDVWEFKQGLSKELTKAIGQKDTPMIEVLSKSVKALKQLREDGYSFATQATGIGEEAGSISAERLARLRQIDAEYAQWQTEIKETGRQLGLGDVSGTRQLADKITKIRGDDKLLNNIINANNADGIEFFRKTYPGAFEEARRFKLGQMLDQATDKNNKFLVTKAMDEVDRIKDPKIRQVLFKDADGSVEKKIKDIQTVLGAIPKDANPSGSGSYVSRTGWLSLQGAKQNAEDAITYSLLEMAPKIQQYTGGSIKAVKMGSLMALKSGAPIEPTAFKRLVDYAQKTIQGETKLAMATSQVFSKAPLVVGNKIAQDVREKLDEKLLALQNDPSPLFEVGQGTGLYAPDHSSALAQTAVQGVNYLNSIRPVAQKKSPLDSEPVINPVAKAQYNRALDIAQDPTIVLADVKNGSVTASDLKHLMAVNPGFYKAASEKLSHELTRHTAEGGTVPYQTRIGLSVFLGQPLDSSMTPESIMAAQFKPQTQQRGGGSGGHSGGGGSGHSLKSLDKLSSAFLTSSQSREAHRGGRH